MTNNKKQSSVQWFLDQLIEHRIIIVNKTTYQVKYKHEILLEQAKEMEKEQTEMYKECLEQFVPIEKWDDATKFLSTHGSGLAKDFSKNETYK